MKVTLVQNRNKATSYPDKVSFNVDGFESANSILENADNVESVELVITLKAREEKSDD